MTILCLALAGLFLGTGIGKVIGYSDMVRDFAHWGYPDWLVVVASALEITGGLLILAPRLASVGAGLLAVSMSGAFLTHVINDQPPKALLTGGLLLLLLLVAVLRWPRSILSGKSVRARPASSPA